MNKKIFSEYTYQIINKLPHWFEVRKNPETTTEGDFLNIIGLSYEELESVFEYIYQQNSLKDSNVNELNFVYKGFIPSLINKETELTISSNNNILEPIEDAKIFLKVSNESYEYPELVLNHPYYIDYENNIIYTKNRYDKEIQLETEQEVIDISLQKHKVWNSFDEFGYWFDLERNPGEDNYNYKKRLLDIFKNKGNSSGQGLANALARELNLRKTRIWKDGSEDLIIKEPMVVYNMIKVDGEFFSEENIKTNIKGDVILKGNPTYSNKEREVSFITGIEIQEINNEDNITMKNRLHDVEGKPTRLKRSYAKKINSQAAILFNQSKIGVHNWSIGSVENTDKGVIESISDVSMEHFIKYGVIEKELINTTDGDYTINTWGDIANVGSWDNVKNNFETWKNVLISNKER